MRVELQPNWAPDDEGANAGDQTQLQGGVLPESQTDAKAESGEPGKEAEPAKADAAAKAEGPGEDTTKAPPPVKAPDWRDGEIARLRAQLAKAKPVTAPAAAQPTTPVSDSKPDADFEQRVAAAAEQRLLAQQFEQSCLAARQAGDATFGQDFGQRINAITSSLVDKNDPVSVMRYNTFLQAAIEAADGKPDTVANIVYQVGGDLNEAARILSLSPVKLGVELAKIGNRSAPAVSSAPKPITPVGGKGAPHTSIDPSDPTRADNLDTATWMRRRAEQRAAALPSRGARR